MSINKRLLEVRNYLNLSQQKIADFLGVSKQTINNLEKGKYGTSGDFLAKFLKNYPGVNARWLILGEGEMIRKDGEYKLNIDGMPVMGEFIPEYKTKSKNTAGKDSEKIAKLIQENESLRKEIKNTKELLKAKEEIIELLKK